MTSGNSQSYHHAMQHQHGIEHVKLLLLVLLYAVYIPLAFEALFRGHDAGVVLWSGMTVWNVYLQKQQQATMRGVWAQVMSSMQRG